jgi:fumarylpyruvate hydrolase
MSKYLFEPPPVPALSIAGLDALYPVARIFCVGRNYEEHAREMGHVVDREKPFYFSKSATALRQNGATIPYPPGTTNYHFECELVVAMGAPAYRIAAAGAKQRPWTLGKDVEASAPVSPIAAAAAIGHPKRAGISLTQNGVTRQQSNISELVWSVPEIIAHLSAFYHLVRGDLIFTGTPAGVGPVSPGDRLEAAIEGVGALTVTIGQEQ